jgi:argininosuccinate lyase
MQEDKEPLFDTVDTLKACLDVYKELIPRLKVNRADMEKAVSKGYLNATDMADYLVTRGMAFREAHHCTGEVIRYAMGQNKELHELSLKEISRFSKFFSEDLFELLTPQQMVNRRLSAGGTATKNVTRAIQKAKNAISREMVKSKGNEKGKRASR